MKLNLGCGKDYRKGYINIDKCHKFSDLSFDLEKVPYPFKDNSIEKILAENVMEHLINFEQALDELHRILKPAGVIEILVPHFSSFHGIGVVQHKRVFYYDSLSYCDVKKEPDDYEYGNRKWEIIENRIIFKKNILNCLFNKHKHIYTTTFLAYLFPAESVKFILKKPC